jgi:hypothetical protein
VRVLHSRYRWYALVSLGTFGGVYGENGSSGKSPVGLYHP